MNGIIKFPLYDTVRIRNEGILWMCGYKNDRLYISFCWDISDTNEISNNYYYHQCAPNFKTEKVTILEKNSDCVMSNWIDMTELIFSNVTHIRICGEEKHNKPSSMLSLSQLRHKLVSSNLNILKNTHDLCTVCYINHPHMTLTLNDMPRDVCRNCFNNTFSEKINDDNLFITLKL